MPKVRWVMSLGFVANFIRFPAVKKFWTSVKMWQSCRDFEGGNFFWDTVYSVYLKVSDNMHGNVFGHICLSVCLSVCPVQALTFESLDLESPYLYACTSSEYLGQVCISWHMYIHTYIHMKLNSTLITKRHYDVWNKWLQLCCGVC